MSKATRVPAMDAAAVEGRSGSMYPARFQDVVTGRVKRRLGDACGLTTFGVNMVDLPPGAASALRHWHTAEDEFVYVLAGEVTLVTDDGEQTLRPGMCAGFPKGVPDGHHLVNRGTEPARYLEVGGRDAADTVHYPDDGMMLSRRFVFSDADGNELS